MMKRIINANVLLLALMFIIASLSLVFISLDNLQHREHYSLALYNNYLQDKFKLMEKININENSLCDNYKQEEIAFSFKNITYKFYCVKNSIFLDKIPTREKYIVFDFIEDWLDIDHYQNEIIKVSSLSDLPESSMNNPKIVWLTAEINQRLEKDFYGVIITTYPFNFTGKKIYGVIYANYPAEKDNRNISFKKEVVQNLDKMYSKWRFLNNSRNLITND